MTTLTVNPKEVLNAVPPTPIHFADLGEKLGIPWGKDSSEQLAALREVLLELAALDEVGIEHGFGWYRLVPCAYCGEQPPLLERAVDPWLWPGRGWMTNCLQCSGSIVELAQRVAEIEQHLGDDPVSSEVEMLRQALNLALRRWPEVTDGV